MTQAYDNPYHTRPPPRGPLTFHAVTANGRKDILPVKLPTCIHCDYDLTAIVSVSQPRCPECGFPIPAAQQEWIKNNATPPTANP